MKPPKTKNRRERLVINRLTDQGYEVIKRGWPDLLAVKDGELRFIEVKPSYMEGKPSGGMSAYQRRMKHILEDAGLSVTISYVD